MIIYLWNSKRVVRVISSVQFKEYKGGPHDEKTNVLSFISAVRNGSGIHTLRQWCFYRRGDFRGQSSDQRGISVGDRSDVRDFGDQLCQTEPLYRCAGRRDEGN